MDNFNNQQQELTYAEGIGGVLSDILKKYQLDETEEQGIKKLEADQPFFGEIVMGLVKDLIFDKIQDKDLTILLQQKLNISQKTAEDLTADIKEKILPLIKKVSVPTEETAEKPVIQIAENNPQPFIKTTPNISVEENENILKEKRVPIAKELKKETKKISNPISIKRTASQPTQPTQSKGPDSYREPIE